MSIESTRDAGSGHAGSGSEGPDVSASNGVRLAVGWTIVGVPLAYGIYQTLVRAASLFGG